MVGLLGGGEDEWVLGGVGGGAGVVVVGVDGVGLVVLS